MEIKTTYYRDAPRESQWRAIDLDTFGLEGGMSVSGWGATAYRAIQDLQDKLVTNKVYEKLRASWTPDELAHLRGILEVNQNQETYWEGRDYVATIRRIAQEERRSGSDYMADLLEESADDREAGMRWGECLGGSA
jgi:hypothetical protein